MCVASMIFDHFTAKWDRHPRTPYRPINPIPYWPEPLIDPFLPREPVSPDAQPSPAISQEEKDEFRELLRKAREYDAKHHEPDCEMEQKKEKLRKLAEELGIDISFE